MQTRGDTCSPLGPEPVRGRATTRPEEGNWAPFCDDTDLSMTPSTWPPNLTKYGPSSLTQSAIQQMVSEHLFCGRSWVQRTVRHVWSFSGAYGLLWERDICHRNIHEMNDHTNHYLIMWWEGWSALRGGLGQPAWGSHFIWNLEALPEERLLREH